MNRLMRRARVLPLMGSALVLAVGLVVAGLAEPASAAVCTHRTGVFHTDVDGGWFGSTWTEDALCGNNRGAPIYLGPTRVFQIGVMDSTTSWFVCWTTGAWHEGQNNIWYYTQGDRAINRPERRAWGFMPAVYVHTTNDPGDSTLPLCE